VHHVEGGCSPRIGGSLIADGIQGGLDADVGGNTRLGPPFTPGATYRLATGGSLKVSLSPDASLNLSLHTGGRIRSYVPDLELEATDAESKGVMGTGDASLEASAGGSITLRQGEVDDAFADGPEFGPGFLEEMEGIGAIIETRVTEAMADMAARLEQGLGGIDSEKLRAQVERAAEGAIRAAERAASGVRREAEREAERARMRAERAERRWQRASGRRSRSRREPATSEEQLRVLRLVEEGKITPEQAADLLGALRGR
jgi:hypothetical protein